MGRRQTGPRDDELDGAGALSRRLLNAQRHEYDGPLCALGNNHDIGLSLGAQNVFIQPLDERCDLAGVHAVRRADVMLVLSAPLHHGDR